MSPAVPVLAALRGMPGIGKTGLARAVGRELGWPVLDKDDIKDDALVRGEDCPLCAEIAADVAENEYGFKVADLRISQVRLSREQHVPGWCQLICRRHVREPHELSPAERSDFFDDSTTGTTVWSG